MASYVMALQAFEEILERLDFPEGQLDPEAQARLGRRAALLATSELTWDEHLGPLYEWSDVATVLDAQTGIFRRKNSLGQHRSFDKRADLVE